MDARPTYFLTQHARTRMAEQRVSLDDIELVLLDGVRTRATVIGATPRTIRSSVIEGRVVEVVVAEEPARLVVITVTTREL